MSLAVHIVRIGCRLFCGVF